MNRQLKDIPTTPILEKLAQHQGKWSTWYSEADSFMPTVRSAMPEWVTDKMAVLKMAKLIKQGLSGGCPCGCRGDYEITDKGLELIGRPRVKAYGGY